MEKWRERVETAFVERFGRLPERIAVTPGRVNLIGEHTDYSGGFVLPAAVPLYTAVATGGRRPEAGGRRLEAGGWTGREDEVRVWSEGIGEVRMAPPAASPRPPGGGTEVGRELRGDFGDYVAGAMWGCGWSGGLDVAIVGDLPVEAGLSSSAALLVGLVGAMRGAARNRGRNAIETARMARRIENEFVGVPCGFMDQFAVACGKAGKALLLDCRDETHVEVDAELPGYRWLVVYSGIQRKLTGGGYGAKVEAVERALARVDAELLRTHAPEAVVEAAAAAGVEDEALPLLRHVSAENARVHLMRHALEHGDAGMAGALLRVGHWSLSRLFGVSTPAIDAFVTAGCDVPGVAGCRLTGAGMGGSLVALVAEEGHEETAARLQALATREMSREARVWDVSGFCDGVRVW